MNKVYKFFAIALFAILLVSLIKYLDTFYDQADIKNAQRVIFGFHPLGKDQPSLFEFMAKDLSISPNQLGCVFRLESASSGTVRVICQKAHGKDQEPQKEKQFSWLVHRVTGRVSAENSESQNLMKSLQKK